MANDARMTGMLVANTDRRAALSVNLATFSRWCVFAALFFSPWYLQWPITLPGLDPSTVSVAANLPKLRPADLFAVVSIGVYVLIGWPGLRKLWTSTQRRWLLSMIALAGICLLSIGWAAQPEIAAVFAIHTVLWILFAVRVACDDLQPASIAVSLLAGLFVNSLVGLAQFAMQHSVGLAFLGELQLDPNIYGLSVVGDDSLRVLRIYGLSGHPNVIGGFAAIALLWSVGLIARSRRRCLPIVLLIWLIGWVTLLLTFSRSAWLGLAIGLGSIAVLAWPRRSHWRSYQRLIALGGIILIPIAALAIAFGPILIDRLTASRSPLEYSSIADRIDLATIAAKLIAERPFTGVGLGNFQIASRALLDPSTEPGWVHNVPLLIASELGLPGLLIWLIGIGLILINIINHYRRDELDIWRTVAAGSLVAILTIMLFDHYWWTSSQGVYVWAGIVGWEISQSRLDASRSN
jgi:O-antigen ligase